MGKCLGRLEVFDDGVTRDNYDTIRFFVYYPQNNYVSYNPHIALDMQGNDFYDVVFYGIEHHRLFDDSWAQYLHDLRFRITAMCKAEYQLREPLIY